MPHRNSWNGTACLLVIVNDFLDHVDGIVAKVQKEQYGQIDDPLYGAFVDAFCDKVHVDIMCFTFVVVSVVNLHMDVVLSSCLKCMLLFSYFPTL